jgi:hypothetical protein
LAQKVSTQTSQREGEGGEEGRGEKERGEGESGQPKEVKGKRGGGKSNEEHIANSRTMKCLKNFLRVSQVHS